MEGNTSNEATSIKFGSQIKGISAAKLQQHRIIKTLVGLCWGWRNREGEEVGITENVDNECD